MTDEEIKERMRESEAYSTMPGDLKAQLDLILSKVEDTLILVAQLAHPPEDEGMDEAIARLEAEAQPKAPSTT